jgi:hypothetical protein
MSSQIVRRCGATPGVVHIVAEPLIDQSDLLRRIGGLDEPFALPAGRGDEARHPGSPDPRETQGLEESAGIYVPDLHIDTLSVKARNSSLVGLQSNRERFTILGPTKIC